MFWLKKIKKLIEMQEHIYECNINNVIERCEEIEEWCLNLERRIKIIEKLKKDKKCK